MGCQGCSISLNGQASGCGGGCSSGGCSTGGCNRLNTYDWLSHLDIEDTRPFDVVEVSFKNGSRKGFYRTVPGVRVHTGDMVAVEAGNGYDIGRITLSGELVRLQMKKKRVTDKQVMYNVVRRAHPRDLERLQEARAQEQGTMVRARVIARSLNLDMKVGDVEYQGDRRKATFYYTAKGRVDFRELIRHYAREFGVKIEMRQIGARQEAARIGGLGSCGRELCCSTWLTDFKSVTTSAARYQNLAINQSKLSGQCGRLKCCLNYELDTYMEALEAFPEKADRLQTEGGNVVLVKTDIFKQLMFYAYQDGQNRGKLYALTTTQVREVQNMNRRGERPVQLSELVIVVDTGEEELDYEDVTGAIELPPEERKRKKKRRNKKKEGGGPSSGAEHRGRGESGSRQPKPAREPKAEAQPGQRGDDHQRGGDRSDRGGRSRRNKPGKDREASANTSRQPAAPVPPVTPPVTDRPPAERPTGEDGAARSGKSRRNKRRGGRNKKPGGAQE